jgi:VWFA-related protein
MPLVATSALLVAQESQQPTFRSGTQLVEVDVRVFDSRGRFVTDLSTDDFEILEQGVRQRIAAMHLIPLGMKPGSDEGSSPLSAAQTWIFVFDLNHLSPGAGFDRAKKGVEDFIADGLPEGDLAGIVAGDKMLTNRITGVRAELIDAVKQVNARRNTRVKMTELTREWPRFLDQEEPILVARQERDVINRVITRACNDDPGYCDRDPRAPEAAVMAKGQQFQQEMHREALASLNALNEVAVGLSRVPGPKTIVLLSDGFASADVETTVHAIAGQAARAGARVYAVDVRGLDQPVTEDLPGGLTAVPKFDMRQDGLSALAIDTGGLMIRNENKVRRALATIAVDASRYYVLAYEPVNTEFNGKYREIGVRVKRPGLTIRARKGYLALDPAKMLLPQRITTAAAHSQIPLLPRAHAGLPATRSVLSITPSEAPISSGATAAIVAAPTASPLEGSVRLRPDAEERIKALSSRESNSAGLLATRGWDAYQRGDVETALTVFTQATATGETRPWVLYALGMSHAALGHAAESVAAWERVRQAAPDFEPVYLDLADSYAEAGDLTRALTTLRNAETRWPRSADVQSAIGVIHVRRGAVDAGITALKKVADAKPDDPLAHLNLGRAYELRYHRGRHYVASQRRWVAPEEDRTKAAEAYQRCIALGGPYARKAADALSTLEWNKDSNKGPTPR